MMSKEWYTAGQAVLVWESLFNVRQYVGTPPITVQPDDLKKPMTVWASCAVPGRSVKPKPQRATTGLPL